MRAKERTCLVGLLNGFLPLNASPESRLEFSPNVSSPLFINGK